MRAAEGSQGKDYELLKDMADVSYLSTSTISAQLVLYYYISGLMLMHQYYIITYP